jgi:hypothetical protein
LTKESPVLRVVHINPKEDEMARQASNLTHARIVELFDYDAATGNLIWKSTYSNRIKVGDVAGSVASNGRRYTSVDGEHQMVHRLVWFLHKGQWPRHNLAPIDGDHLNTRIENLVEQTPSETAKKGGLRSTNKTGVKGVTWDAEKKEYAVYGYVDGRSKFDSRHKTLEAATVAAKRVGSGVFMTDDERRVLHDSKIKRNHMWKRMVKGCNGLHDWSSIDQFVVDVGLPPHENSRLVPVDDARRLGPGNFAWTDPKVDHRTKEARRVAEKREANREWYRDGHLKRKFGISHADYVAKLLEQKGVCAICKNPETSMQDGRLREMAVDHDHETDAVRGLLCLACNVAIGAMQDDIPRLRAAIAYLEKWSATSDNVVSINGGPLGFGT